MNEQDAERFEAQAVATLAAMKELFDEFQKRLGEVVAAQRLASSEARSEGAKARAALEEISRQARAIAEAQRQAIAELRGEWRLHVAENSKAAGAEMAVSFGEEIAAGLERKLVTMTQEVERATGRFEWVTALKWSGGVAVGIVLTIGLGVWALLPNVPGVSPLRVRVAMSQIGPCQIGEEQHVCMLLENPPRFTKGPDGKTVIVVRGL